ncbi:hypothetical protein [Flagellimonas sp. 2504JD4-2]
MANKLYFPIFILLASCSALKAQQDIDCHISTIEGAQHLVCGASTAINIPENSCYEYIEEKTITVGEKFIIIQVLDEMYNNRGALIFDKNGTQINFDIVQAEREKYYEHYNCCINVKEYQSRLYFWDMVDENGEDYNCYYDSQTEYALYSIPRYYIFDAKKNTVETKIVKNPCSTLFQGGELVCN